MRFFRKISRMCFGVVFLSCVVSGCENSSLTNPDLTADAGEEIDTGAPYDCEGPPIFPVTTKQLVAPRGDDGLAFDDKGYIFGVSGSGYLLKAKYTDDLPSLFADGIETPVYQMVFSPQGDLYFCSDISVYKVFHTGYLSKVANLETWGYGITIGPDLHGYITSTYKVYRLDFDTDELEVYFDLAPYGIPISSVAFNPERTLMYMSTLLYSSDMSESGKLYAVELNTALRPKGDPFLFTDGIGQGQLGDVKTDICGNLYLPEEDTRALYMVTPEGEVSKIIDFQATDPAQFGNSVAWGSGIGGWKDNSIYMPQPWNENNVLEVELGVPSLISTYR